MSTKSFIIFFCYSAFVVVWHSVSAYSNGYSGRVPGAKWLRSHVLWISQREWFYIPVGVVVDYYFLNKTLWLIPGVAWLAIAVWVAHNVYYVLGDRKRQNDYISLKIYTGNPVKITHNLTQETENKPAWWIIRLIQFVPGLVLGALAILIIETLI
jgi:hypothetical protein